MLNMTFEINTLPKPARRSGGVSSVIVYFEHLLEKYDSDCEQCAFLPSLSELSRFLNCPMVDIHTALHRLRNKGYDFFIFGTDCPITLSYPQNKDQDAIPWNTFTYG